MDNATALTVCLNPTLQKTLIFRRIRPGEVNRAESVRLDASGKGVNVTRVLGELGRSAVHITQSGGLFADLFKGLCKADGLDLRAVETGADIRFCTTAIDLTGGGGSTADATELVEAGHRVDPGTEERVREAFLDELARCSLVIISGSKAPGFSDALFPWMAGGARERGVPVILDYRGGDLKNSLPHSPDIVKINREELIETFGSDSDEVFAEAYRSHRTWLIMTDGAAGVRFWNGMEVEIAHPPSVEGLNPIGSGDAFCAGLASVLLGEIERKNSPSSKNFPMSEMVREGIRCGAENARRLKPGSITGSPGYQGV